MKQTKCKLCGAPFVCDNGTWSTTCDCARLRPDELRAAQGDAMPRLSPRAGELLHRLWSRAVGLPGYDKAEWVELQRLIEG